MKEKGKENIKDKGKKKEGNRKDRGRKEKLKGRIK